jgi:hypothetical protein
MSSPMTPRIRDTGGCPSLFDVEVIPADEWNRLTSPSNGPVRTPSTVVLTSDGPSREPMAKQLGLLRRGPPGDNEP